MVTSSASLATASELVHPAQPSAIERLFTEHYPWVWRTIRRLGVQDALVDDCAQQVFLVASKRLATVALANERAFLMAVVQRVASNARRSQARRREDADAESVLQHAADANPEELLDWKQRRERLDDWLDGLTLELRAPFVLFELERLTLVEIAELLGLPLGTVKTRLRKARESFLLVAEAGVAR